MGTNKYDINIYSSSLLAQQDMGFASPPLWFDTIVFEVGL